ncbi:MAG: formylglycine-generating enzyme family protein, partial [Planctomycetota bacterium]|nr:formylglycine-generating enzyme family protein [Planctomycetota bacterium]
MPRCIECHENYSDQLRRCPYCGASPEAPIGDGSVRTGGKQAWPDAGAKKKQVRRVVLGLVALLLMAVAGVIAWPSADSDDPGIGLPYQGRRTKPPPPPVHVDRTADPVETDFALTAVLALRDSVFVTGTCSPRGVVRVEVNGQAASLRPDGASFQIRLFERSSSIEAVAYGIEGKTARLTAEVPPTQAEVPPARLLSHTDGITVQAPTVRVRIGRADAEAETREVSLEQVENVIRLEGAEFTLYRAPRGFVFLRMTEAGHYTFLRESDGQEMILVPGGYSYRGIGDKPPHGPRQLIELSPFLIDRTEVTCAQYGRFLAFMRRSGDASLRHPDDPGVRLIPVGWNSPTKPPQGSEKHPVAGVSWYAAYAYARWVRGELPTEAQWERAVAGPTGHRYAWGDTLDPLRVRAGAGGPVAAASLVSGRSF